MAVALEVEVEKATFDGVSFFRGRSAFCPSDASDFCTSVAADTTTPNSRPHTRVPARALRRKVHTHPPPGSDEVLGADGPSWGLTHTRSRPFPALSPRPLPQVMVYSLSSVVMPRNNHGPCRLAALVTPRAPSSGRAGSARQGS